MDCEKKCSHCGFTKPSTEFHKNRSTKDGLAKLCKSCVKELYPNYKRTYREKKTDAYVNNYQNHKERMLRNSKSYRDSRLELLWSLKTPCAKCGETRKCSLQFHHIDPSTKSVALSDGSVGKARILEEVKKCICLCANCHEEFHYIYGQQPENPVEALKKYLGRIDLDEITRKQEAGG